MFNSVKKILQLTPGKNRIVPLDDDSKDRDILTFVDGPAEIMPDHDNAGDRDHFPDETPEAEIDQLLESMNTPYWIKHGRPEIIDGQDPDVDPDVDPEDDLENDG